MKYSPSQVSEWLEIVRIARVEIILDKVADILVGLDLGRSAHVWRIWEEASEQNTRALESWELSSRLNLYSDDWLSADLQDQLYGQVHRSMDLDGTEMPPD